MTMRQIRSMHGSRTLGIVRHVVRGVALLALANAAVPAAILAQGTLSGLGFGYPVGGTSTRAAATGGSFAEFDALTPRNPSSVGGLTRTLIAAQTEPEFRTLTLGGVKERTTAQRVPLLVVAFPASRGIGVALSASTFLDRSFTTVTTGTVEIDGRTLQTQDRSDVRGSIGDLRGAVGWRPNARFSLGVAGHLFTGDNSVATSRTFDDTTAFGSVLDSSRVTYFGTGLSIGGELRIVRGLAASASYRSGGRMEARVRDSVRTRANVPHRLGAALRYDGIAGSTFAVGIEQHAWSRMQGLGSSVVRAHDATNWHAGAEVAGPRVRGSPVQLRVGYARNNLPFGLDERTVSESRMTAGFGVSIAGDDAAGIDFSIQRANRALSGSNAKESAWLVGLGVQLRP